jgi:hypothetical protein
MSREFRGWHGLDANAVAKAIRMVNVPRVARIAGLRHQEFHKAARAAQAVQSEELRRVVRAAQGIRFPPERLLDVARQHGEAMKRLVDEAFPPNWEGREVGEVDQILELSLRTGLNTVWVPRLDVIRELLNGADDEARDAVLVRRQPEIMEDIDGSLDCVTHESMVEELRLTRAAVASLRDGHAAPAQALAASVLSGIVHTTFAFSKFAEARARFVRDDPNEVALRVFRLTAILHTLARALTKTDEADHGFNRHKSLHAHEGHYTRAHAISALMLLAGVLREVDLQLNRQPRETHTG